MVYLLEEKALKYFGFLYTSNEKTYGSQAVGSDKLNKTKCTDSGNEVSARLPELISV